MFPTLITGLAKAGLSSLASDLMDSVLNKGKDVVTDTIRDVTGLDLDLDTEPTQEDIDAIAKGSDHIVEKLQAQVRLAEIGLEDVQGAREQFKTMQASDSYMSKHFLEVFSLVIFIGSAFFFFEVMKGDHSDPLVATMIQFVFGVDMLVVGFWFGSSKGSKDKTKVIANQRGNEDDLY